MRTVETYTNCTIRTIGNRHVYIDWLFRNRLTIFLSAFSFLRCSLVLTTLLNLFHLRIRHLKRIPCDFLPSIELPEPTAVSNSRSSSRIFTCSPFLCLILLYFTNCVSMRFITFFQKFLCFSLSLCYNITSLMLQFSSILFIF